VPQNILFFLPIFAFSCAQNRNEKASLDTVKKNGSINFIGAWSSTSEGKPTSLYIDTTGNVYNIYFIASDGESKNYTGILENNILKIGNTHNIKFLSENDGIYLVEGGINYKRMKSVQEVLRNIKNEIKENPATTLSQFFYFPFEDPLGKGELGISPDFTITREQNISIALEKLVDESFRKALMSPKLELTNYYGIQKSINPEYEDNYLSPWEFSFDFKHSSGRELTIVFSIRENGYSLTRIQFFS
jgi:hypothetical protein